MWDLIVSVPDHCLSFYLGQNNMCVSGFSSKKIGMVGRQN